MKRCLIPILIILVLASGLLIGCSGEPSATPELTPAELQAEVKVLRDDLNQLRSQIRAEKRASILKQADAYNAVVKFISDKNPKPIASANMTNVQKTLQDEGKLWSLIKATGDPVLISSSQPQGVWNAIPVTRSSIKDYAEAKYQELMAEYNRQ